MDSWWTVTVCVWLAATCRQHSRLIDAHSAEPKFTSLVFAWNLYVSTICEVRTTSSGHFVSYVLCGDQSKHQHDSWIREAIIVSDKSALMQSHDCLCLLEFSITFLHQAVRAGTIVLSTYPNGLPWVSPCDRGGRWQHRGWYFPFSQTVLTCNFYSPEREIPKSY